jgi:hypothetical protein
VRWLLVITAFACSQPAKPPHRPTYATASADQANPVRLALEDYRSGDQGVWLTTRAPRDGTWWYAIENPERPGMLSTLELTVGSPTGAAGLTVAWLDEHAEVHPVTQLDATSTKLALSFPETPPPRVLLRVTTTKARLIQITGYRAYRELASSRPPPAPPCDPDNIDRDNPNCANVHPRCDLNDPDFSNPRCCMPRGCEYGRLTCKGKIVQYDAKSRVSSVTISLSAKDEIVVGARGRLFQRVDRQERFVSHVWVRGVSETESLIGIDSPDAVDPKKLADSWVILSAPDACQRR